MGKNVKGFEIGDRCVADVGITVGTACHDVGWERSDTPNHSAETASIVDVGNRCCVKISMLVVSRRMGVSPNTSSSK